MHFKDIRILFYISLVVSALLSVFQHFYTIDPITGFFKPGYTRIGVIMVIFSFLIVAIMVAACLTIRRCPIKMPNAGSLCVMVFLVNCAAVLFDAFSLPANVSMPFWQNAALKITGILAAAFFAALALKRLANLELHKIFFVAPVLYYLFKLIYTFTITSNISLITSNLFELASQVFILLFMFEFASFANGLNSDRGYKKIAATGFAAILLGVDSAFPQLAVFVTNKTADVRFDISTTIETLATVCFIYCFLRRFFSGKNLERHHRHKSSSSRPRFSDDESGGNFYTG